MAANIIPENALSDAEQTRRLRLSTQVAEKNKTSLHELKTRQIEEGKRHTVRKRPQYVEGEPKEAWHSRLTEENGDVAVTHLIVEKLRSWSPRSPPPSKLRCAISGKPARYVDPLTRQPYRGIAEFKELRRTV